MPATDDDDPGLTAQLAAETAAADEQWPDDWPELRPLLTLPRKERADVLDAYAGLIEKLPELNATPDGDAPEDPDQPKSNAGRPAWAAYAKKRKVAVTADMGRDAIIEAVEKANPVDYTTLAANARRTALAMRLVGDLEDVIVLAAVDADAVREWLAAAGDWEVISMFASYARRTQVGEASSSGS